MQLLGNKIFLTWLVLSISLMSVWLFSSVTSPTISILTNLLFLTIFIVCIFIIAREKQSSNKVIFINFLLFSSYFLITTGYSLIKGILFPDTQTAHFYYYQYGTIYYHIFLFFAITYLVIDMLFRQRKIVYKYAISIVIVVFVSSTYYGQFFKDRDYLYNNQDIVDWIEINKVQNEIFSMSGNKATVEEIASSIQLSVWRNGKPVGELYTSQKIDRVKELLPYSDGQNYLVLLMRPLHKANVYINTFTMLLIFFFFAYQYRKDPPQGAYIEKIMFLFLVLVSLESLHSWAYVRSVDWSIFVEFFVLGQYLTFSILGLLTLFFILRLRFISTVQGEFYEHQLVSHPQRITRWRDWVDNFVLSYIFNTQTLVGRLLAPGKEQRH
jgi:hypothetical protein